MRVSRLAFLCALAGGAWAQADLPCTVTNGKSGFPYRVATNQVVYVACDQQLTQFAATANLLPQTTANAVGTSVPAQVSLFLPQGSSDSRWLKIELAAGQTLISDEDYRLVIAPNGQATAQALGQPAASGPFRPLTVQFSTKAAAAVAASLHANDSGKVFTLVSNIAFCDVSHSAIAFDEIDAAGKPIGHAASATPYLHSDAPVCAADNSYPTMPIPDEPNFYGEVQLALTSDKLEQATATISVTGLTDIFGKKVTANNDVPLKGVPKTKDASAYYLLFSHQAGPGSLPAWVADVKIAPTLGRPMLGGFFWSPSLNADIGSGTVGTTKANDTIAASLGITRLIRLKPDQPKGDTPQPAPPASPSVNNDQLRLEAIRFTPALTFETNREFNQRNLVSDLDFAFSISPLERTRLERSWSIYNKLNNPKLKFSPDLASFGAGVQFFLGSEIGHDILAEKVTASKSTAFVMVPPYPIARLRPRMSAFLEYKRLSLTLTAATRYVFLTEWVTRQSTDGKTIRLDPVSGFRPYGEAGVKITLDQSGHIALNSTYKLGSQPPTFQYVNSVQSGLLFIY